MRQDASSYEASSPEALASLAADGLLAVIEGLNEASRSPSDSITVAEARMRSGVPYVG